jgi:hypothetical protein
MGDLKAKLILDEPLPCPNCGADVWEVYANWCKDCTEPVYLAFLKVVGMKDPRRWRDNHA